jgi:hypothetical protein
MIVKNGIMQGSTTLEANQTFQHGEKIGLDVICRICNKPFVDSLQENGIVLDGVVCSGCSQEIAFVVEMTDAQIYGETLRGL